MRGILNKDSTPSQLSKANHFGTGIYDFSFYRLCRGQYPEAFPLKGLRFPITSTLWHRVR